MTQTSKHESVFKNSKCASLVRQSREDALIFVSLFSHNMHLSLFRWSLLS